MKRREDEKVLLIAETYWLESIALVQDPAASYLLDLADKKKIEIAVPEYSFYEADGSLSRKLIKRAEKIDDALSLLGQISQSGHSAELCKRGRSILKELKERTLSDKNEIKRVLDEIKTMIQIIPYVSHASAIAEMIFESSRPPFKVGDCRIYASILAFIEHMTEKYDLIIFYTEDKEDFDYVEIREELETRDVELVIDSGTCVDKVIK